jgi:hypothetical protein
MMDYREVWHEDNFKFSSDTRRLNHVSWDNYKREKRQYKTLYRLARFIKHEHEEILFFVGVASVLFITFTLLN